MGYNIPIKKEIMSDHFEKISQNTGRIESQETLPNTRQESQFHFMEAQRVIVRGQGTNPDRNGYRYIIYRKKDQERRAFSQIRGTLSEALQQARQEMAQWDKKEESVRVTFKDGSYIDLPKGMEEWMFQLALRYVKWDREKETSKEALLAGRPVFLASLNGAQNREFSEALLFAVNVEKEPEKFFKRD